MRWMVVAAPNKTVSPTLDQPSAREHLAGMDPRFFSFQVAAGILLAALIVLFLKLGMNIYRNNGGLRGAFGAGMFIGGICAGASVLLVGFLAHQ